MRGDDGPPLPAPTPVPDSATLEREFEQRLSGATLQGFFDVSGRQDGQPLKEEKYSITKVSKLKNGFWLITCRIQYGKHDANISLPIEVKWAADTPVMTLTNVNVPGFGTFTCRILIYRDQYAGTWSGGDHGGHLFGRIVKE